MAVVAVLGAVGLGLLFAASQWSSAPVLPPRPVVVATSEWQPFVSPDLEGDGPLARVVSEALRLQGYDPEISFSSWPIAQERALQRQVVGVFPLIASEQRRDEFLVSDPLLEFEYVLFYNADRWMDPPELATPADMRELRIGLVEGYDVWEELDEAVEQFVEYETSIEAFRALERNEIDLLAEGLVPGRAIVEGPQMTADARSFGVIEAAGNPLLGATETVHLMLPRTDEGRRLLPGFNAALADVRSSEMYREALDLDGSLDAIVELEPIGQSPTVDLWDSATGSELRHAPAGTTARVVQWPTAFTDGVGPPGRIPVKILDGPAGGQVVYVDPGAVRLSGGTT